tara:strand:- start:666 stop:806 length:141 start_codon:yes stop_codon:yes gene_type:complete
VFSFKKVSQLTKEKISKIKKKEKFQNEKHKKRSTRDLMNELRESKS